MPFPMEEIILKDGPSTQTSAGFAQNSCICSIFNQLVASRALLFKIDEAVILAVVSLQRYLAESQTGTCKDDDCYTYDVTVTDGIWRAKCRLASNLNDLVQKNILRVGTDVQITQCSYIYDERRLGHGSVFIEKVEVGSEKSLILPSVKDVDSLPLWSKEGVGNVMLQNDAPTQTARKHYLSLWNNEDPHSVLWVPDCPPTELVLDVSRIVLLCDLESSFGGKSRHLPLLVRIMHKSRLRFYGKLETKIDFPFQAYFEVADQSGSMSMVLWNALCLEWYQRLNVGSVLYLQNYTLKRSYQNRSRPCPGDPLMKNFTAAEICLNPRDPTAIINVVPPKSVQPQWGLPDVIYQFMTSSELESLPNNHVCDVIGLVTFVGRCERIKNKGSMAPGKHWTYRWVHAVDGTSDRPFVLEIFASSQPEIFNGICPMTYLVCTQMRVCREAGTFLHLTSSCETQVFITGFHKGQPYVSDPKVRSFIQWTKTLKESMVQRRTAIGGHYCFPPSPPLFTQTLASGSASVPVVAASELQRELESLQYREHKRLAIQGQIVAVQYVPWPEEDPESAERVLPMAPPQTAPPGGEVVPTQTDVDSEPSDTIQGASPKRRKREVRRRYLTRAMVNLRREASQAAHTDEEPSTVEVENTARQEGSPETASVGQPNPTGDLLNTSPQEERVAGGRPGASWVSSTWAALQGGLSEHFRFGRLQQESIPRKFSFEDREHLLLQNNFHPGKWMPEEGPPAQNPKFTPVACKGYYRVTILGINQRTAIEALFVPVLSPDDPRSVGLPRDSRHDTLLSCLSSGFLCPLGDHPDPGEILQTAGELEAMHLVCLVDFCHLGGEKVEVFINKVYKMADVALV